MKYLLVICVIFTSFIYGQTVTGTVIDIQRSKPISYAIVTFLTKDKERHVQITDETGKFVFSNLAAKVYTITFSSIGYRDTTFMELSVKGDTTIRLSYLRNCPYDNSIKNKTCPKCKKKSKVIPIIYGLPISLNGRDPTKGNGKKFILAGCEITDCDPNWFCKRDNVSF